MSWHTTKAYSFARRLARSLGITKFIVNLRPQRDYEARFSELMTELVRPGFVIWDIGANRGYYTKILSKLVKSEGKVYAIEPSPKNISVLQQAVYEIDNVKLIEGALSDEIGLITFLEDKGKGTTSRIVDANFKPTTGQNLTTVPVMTGDTLTIEKKCTFPDLIKIDTEGFELEVISGMSETLKNKQLKAVCIEVHFRRLDERGLDHAPREIENRLKRAGFSVNWCDPSHIIATRGLSRQKPPDISGKTTSTGLSFQKNE